MVFLNHPFPVDYPVSTRKRKSQITAQGESNELKKLEYDRKLFFI